MLVLERLLPTIASKVSLTKHFSTLTTSIDLYTLDLDENSVSLTKTPDAILRNGGKDKFFFTEVFSKEATQKDVTRATCLPLISDLFHKSNTISAKFFKLTFK